MRNPLLRTIRVLTHAAPSFSRKNIRAERQAIVSLYENLVMQTQVNFERYQFVYARGSAPYQLAGPSPLSYDEQIERLVREVGEADCVLVGGRVGPLRCRRGRFLLWRHAVVSRALRQVR